MMSRLITTLWVAGRNGEVLPDRTIDDGSGGVRGMWIADFLQLQPAKVLTSPPSADRPIASPLAPLPDDN